MRKTAVKKTTGKKSAGKKYATKLAGKFAGKFAGKKKKFAKPLGATTATGRKAAPPRKKGGPLLSKKPGANQVARPRVPSQGKALSPGKKKDL